MDKVKPVVWPDVLEYMRKYFRENSHQRLGQAYFNALTEIYPEVAELVRGTPSDPFYAEELRDERFTKFFDLIMPYFT